MRIHLIAAARPNFMKIAPLYHALLAADDMEPVLIHTGQHYDANMSDVFFRDLNLPRPDFHLEVGSGSHAEQTARVMMAYEKTVAASPPDWIVVVGDVNSTLAAALVGTKLHIPVAHLEAGLRSGDRRMPEEINRLATDAIVDLLWTPSADADANLRREGHAEETIELVGNIMMDSYELMKARIRDEDMAGELGLDAGKYGVVTLHRPSNVDDPDLLATIVDELCAVSDAIPLVFAVHPRTRKNLEATGLLAKLEQRDRIHLLEPQNYVRFMGLVSDAGLIITDSGGIQEETTYLGIPCLTVRDTTERPITIEQGTNRLVPVVEIRHNVERVLRGEWETGKRPALWDGKTAGRCVDSLRRRAGR